MKLKLVFKINTLYKSISYKYSLYYLYNKINRRLSLYKLNK